MSGSKRNMIVILIAILFFLSLQSISLPSRAHALESYKAHFLQGMEYKEKGQCEEAIEEFSKALSESDKEQKMTRFYGMRYGEYFPHREKGICHYTLKQYKSATEELETSLVQEPTDRARKYLDMAKAEMKRGTQEVAVEIVKIPEELKIAKAARAENRYAVAVVIGNRDYKDKDVPPVNYAIRDATMVKDYLVRTFGYREGNIIFETNATKGTLENIFGTASNPKGKLHDYVMSGKSDLFIYYSGHGAPSVEDRKGYIMPTDGNANTIQISGYPLDLLYKNLAGIPYRKMTIVTDACFSGALLLKKASPVGIIVQNPLVAMQNVFIMNSSSGTELSSWYPDKGHGLFTYYFLLGLTGKADLNGDGQVTFEELTAYINENVPYMARKLHERKQTPTFDVSDKDTPIVSYK